MNRIRVFAGSSPGAREEYSLAARDLGRALAHRQIGVVYGGARVGLMGALADTVLTAGGHVTGVIPEGLVTKEIAHEGLTELRVVASMHERKAMMSRSHYRAMVLVSSAADELLRQFDAYVPPVVEKWIDRAAT